MGDVGVDNMGADNVLMIGSKATGTKSSQWSDLVGRMHERASSRS